MFKPSQIGESSSRRRVSSAAAAPSTIDKLLFRHRAVAQRWRSLGIIINRHKSKGWRSDFTHLLFLFFLQITMIFDNSLLTAILWGLVLRLSTMTYPHSGQNKPPMYGDFEAQRHWMEVHKRSSHSACKLSTITSVGSFFFLRYNTRLISLRADHYRIVSERMVRSNSEK